MPPSVENPNINCSTCGKGFKLTVNTSCPHCGAAVAEHLLQPFVQATEEPTQHESAAATPLVIEEPEAEEIDIEVEDNNGKSVSDSVNGSG